MRTRAKAVEAAQAELNRSTILRNAVGGVLYVDDRVCVHACS